MHLAEMGFLNKARKCAIPIEYSQNRVFLSIWNLIPYTLSQFCLAGFLPSTTELWTQPIQSTKPPGAHQIHNLSCRTAPVARKTSPLPQSWCIHVVIKPTKHVFYSSCLNKGYLTISYTHYAATYCKGYVTNSPFKIYIYI